jgi:hypothetical protein
VDPFVDEVGRDEDGDKTRELVFPTQLLRLCKSRADNIEKVIEKQQRKLCSLVAHVTLTGIN